MTRNRYKMLETDYPYFITCTIVDWMPLLKPDRTKQILIDSIKFLRTNKRIKLFAYVILHEHLHLIVSSARLAQDIGSFKSFTAHSIIEYYQNLKATDILQKLHAANPDYRKDCEHKVWQEGYCPKQIFNFDVLKQKIDYIHLNPVRKGYVKTAEEWIWSSARNYAGMGAKIDIDFINE